MKARDVQGFDYRVQGSRTQPMPAWKLELEDVCVNGGGCWRVAGDLTAFDAQRRMLFEIYDQD